MARYERVIPTNDKENKKQESIQLEALHPSSSSSATLASSSSSFSSSLALSSTVPPLVSTDQHFYRHSNGNLLSSTLTPIPARPASVSYTAPLNPRASSADWVPCPTGNAPNPNCRYTRARSGFEAEPTVGLWEWITFGWVTPLIATGYKRDIDVNDLYLLPEQYQAKVYTQTLFDCWHQNKDLKRYRFAWTIWHAYSPILKKMWVLKIFIIALTLCRPIVLSFLLRGVTAGDSLATSFMLIFALAVVSMIQALCVHHFWWDGVAVAMSVRGATIGLVYDKSLKLHSSERAVWTSGKITNLANVDCDNIRDFMWGAVHETWGAPVVILLTAVCLFLLLGFSALIGVALLILSLYITSRLCRLMSIQQITIMKHSDERVSLMAELIFSMKLVKLYAWESFFSERVMEVRSHQMRSILRQAFIGSMNRCLGLTIPLLVSFLTFTCFILTDGYGSFFSHTLDASTAFTSLLLFNMLKEPLAKLPDCISNAIRLFTSLGRLETFLVIKEQDQYVEHVIEPPKDGLDVIMDGTFDWGVRLMANEEEDATSTNGTKRAPSNPPNQLNRHAPTAIVPHRPLHAITDSIELSEDEESDEDEIDLEDDFAHTNGALSLADDLHKEQQFQAKQQRKRAKEAKKLEKRRRSPDEERVGLTNGSNGDSDDLTLDLSPSPTIPLTRTLPNLSLRIPAGQLWMVVGAVGSAKSSLLAAILGEMTSETNEPTPPPSSRQDESEIDGIKSVRCRRRVAYTSQVAWLQSATIRENILFGLPMDEHRYHQTIHVCALEPDLKRFPLGDSTVVGENGLTLSGGQKARLVLARAVYSSADVYLFDEPLAAVDSHVSRWLFDRAIGPNSILARKTRILVTHQIQFASPAIDCIIVMKNGRVVAKGTYYEVQQQGVDLQTILKQTHQLETDDGENESNVDDKEDGSVGVEVPSSASRSLTSPRPLPGIRSDKPSATTASSSSNGLESSPTPASPPLQNVDLNESSTDAASVDEDKPAVVDGPVQYKDEDLQVGTMSSDTYKEYFRSGAGVLGYLFVAFLVLTSQAASIGSDYFLANWSSTITHAVAAAEQANLQQSNAAAGQLQGQAVTPNHYIMYAIGVQDPWTSLAAHHSEQAFQDVYFAETAASANVTYRYQDFLAHDSSWYIGIYGILVMSSAALLLIRSIYIAFTTVSAARVIHDRLFRGLIRAPQWFYEATPSGRILNRCAKDVEQVDMVLPGCVQDILACGSIVLATIILIVVVAWVAIFPLALIAALYYYVQLYYHPTSRQLKRLESVTRSPIYQEISETAAGITSIRSYAYTGALHRCMEKLYLRVDMNTRVMYYSFSVHRWLGIRLEAIGALIVFVASSLALTLSGSLGVGLVGLTISSTLSLAGNLNWTVRQVSEMENQLNSVERILEYARVEPELGLQPLTEEEAEEKYSSDPIKRLEKKKDASLQPHRQRANKRMDKKKYTSVIASSSSPSSVTTGETIDVALTIRSSSPSPVANWPSEGSILFENLSLAYRPHPSFPLVLSEVSASIKGGEKIGIVGRTGAGKSTLSLALFRLIDVRSGRIVIDGVDISTIPLNDLRSRLSVIPQESILWTSSLRNNLDPFHECTDERLYEILEMVHLRTAVESLPGGLDFIVADGGTNFSLGERQLLCLGRAIVRNSKIVIMDEATSSLDFETDQLLKRLVAEQFADCTVLTIAHRLNTILDSDRILVFEAGRLVEFDTPKKLLSDPNGYLTWLVHETNEAGKIHARENK